MQNRFIAGAVLAVLAIYLITIAPGIFWRDSSEFVMLPFNIDIGHPAGSPTFTMLAGLMARMPIGSIAFRSNAVSTLMGALAVFCFIFAASRIIRRIARDLSEPVTWTLAFFSVSPLFFSTGIWYWAVTAEVYTSLLGSVALVIGLSLSRAEKTDFPDQRILLTISLLLGLSCGLHMVMILYAPAFGVYLFLTRKKDFAIGRIFLFAIMFFTGFSVFALLPIRSLTNPPFDYGNPETMQAFLGHITGRNYSELLQSFPWHRIMENLGHLVGHIRTQLSIFHGLLALAGLGVLLVRAPRVALFLVLIAFGHFYLYVRDWSIDFGYLTIYLLVALMAAAALGFGAQQLLKKGPAMRTPLAAGFALLAVFFAAFQAYANFDYCNRNGHDLTLRQTRQVLDSMPPDSMLVSYEDNLNYASVYTQSIERWREDVIHFHRAFLEAPDVLAARYSDLDLKALDGTPYAYQRFLLANAGKHPPFWDFGWEGPEWLHLENLEPFGRLMRIRKEPVMDLEAAHQSSMEIWNKTIGPIVSDPLFNKNDWTAIEITARFWSNRAKYYFDRGNRQLAKASLARALELRPDFAPFRLQQASLLAAAGKSKQAFAALETGLALDPLDDKLWLTKGHLAIRNGDFKTAVPALTRALELNKAQVDGANFLAHARYQLGEYIESENAARAGLVYAKDPDRIARLKDLLALSLMRQQRFGEAKSHLEDILHLHPKDQRIKQLLAACTQQMKNP